MKDVAHNPQRGTRRDAFTVEWLEHRELLSGTPKLSYSEDQVGTRPTEDANLYSSTVEYEWEDEASSSLVGYHESRDSSKSAQQVVAEVEEADEFEEDDYYSRIVSQPSVSLSNSQLALGTSQEDISKSRISRRAESEFDIDDDAVVTTPPPNLSTISALAAAAVQESQSLTPVIGQQAGNHTSSPASSTATNSGISASTQSSSLSGGGSGIVQLVVREIESSEPETARATRQVAGKVPVQAAPSSPTVVSSLTKPAGSGESDNYRATQESSTPAATTEDSKAREAPTPTDPAVRLGAVSGHESIADTPKRGDSKHGEPAGITEERQSDWSEQSLRNGPVRSESGKTTVWAEGGRLILAEFLQSPLPAPAAVLVDAVLCPAPQLGELLTDICSIDVAAMEHSFDALLDQLEELGRGLTESLGQVNVATWVASTAAAAAALELVWRQRRKKPRYAAGVVVCREDPSSWLPDSTSFFPQDLP